MGSMFVVHANEGAHVAACAHGTTTALRGIRDQLGQARAHLRSSMYELHPDLVGMFKYRTRRELPRCRQGLGGRLWV